MGLDDVGMDGGDCFVAGVAALMNGRGYFGIHLLLEEKRFVV